jgi:methyl coenzyme M reductase subunit C
MEKPKAAIIVKVPINDSGMAMVGIRTERTDPRKTKTTSVTMTSASTRVRMTSSIALFTNSVES